MEVKSVQNISYPTTRQTFCAKQTVTNPYSGAKKEIELPDIKSAQYALNVRAPQNYAHINTFEIPQVGKAHFYKLQNGQRVIIIPTEGETVVKTHVNVGSMNEPDNIRGISHYIEHNLFNGTDNLNAGEFFKQTNRMGAKTNASTGFAKTDYYIATHLLDDKDLEKTIQLHADMIENPAFKLDQLEKEKGPIISEIAMVLDNDENLAVNKAIKNLYQINSTSTDIIAGEARNIQNVTRDDVINYYKTWYTPDNMVTVITGEINPDETIKLIAKNFKKQAPQNTGKSYFEQFTPVEKPVREDFISTKSPSSKIVLATVGPQNNNAKENLKAEALLTYLLGYKSAILKSKLLKDGISVSPNMEKLSNSPYQSSVMMIIADTPADKTEKVIKTIYSTIENTYNNPPSDEDMEAVKNNMLKSYRTVVKNSDGLNNFIAQGFLNADIDSLQNLENIVKNLTAKDIQDAAKQYLDLNKVSLVVSHASNLDKVKIEANYNKNYKQVAFGAAKKLSITNPNEVKQIILPNNMTLMLENTKSDLSTAQVVLNTQIPADINPIAPYLLSEILSTGNRGTSEADFRRTLDTKAISLSFDVSDKGIVATTNSNAKDLEVALANIKDTLTSPKLDVNTFNKAKEKALNVVMTSTNSAYDYAMKELFMPRYQKFGVKSDYLKALDKVTLDDVKNLYNYIITNASAYSAITTNHTEKINQNSNITKTLSQLGKTFKDFEYGLGKTYENVDTSKIITNVREQKQADIMQVYTFEQGENLKDKVTIDLLNMVLGGTPSSRLFSELREKQKLAYRVNSSLENFGNTGIIKLNILTTTEDKDNNVQSFENVQKSLNGFKKHINILKTQNISSEELEGVKRFLKSRILEIKDSQNSKNSSILTTVTKHEGLEYYNKYLKMIDEITAEDIKNAANYVFAGNSITSIIASKNTIDSLK